MEQILHVPQRQRKPDIHHHRQADDLGRCLEIAERISHPKTLRNRPDRLKPIFLTIPLAMPFVIRIWIVFLSCLVIGAAVSIATAKPQADRPVDLTGVRFATGPVFNIAGAFIVFVLVSIYVIFW